MVPNQNILTWVFYCSVFLLLFLGTLSCWIIRIFWQFRETCFNPLQCLTWFVKIKLIKNLIFLQDGQVNMVEESIARKKKTSDANLFLVPFDRYNLSESMPLGTVCFEFLSCEMNHVTLLLKKNWLFRVCNPKVIS